MHRRRRRIEKLIRDNTIVLEALTYIRGRSIPRQYVIIDEAQNLTPHEVKTIISRAGEGTKMVLTGDPYQIDNPYLDASSNGLTYAAERLKDQAAARPRHAAQQRTQPPGRHRGRDSCSPTERLPHDSPRPARAFRGRP